MTDIEKTSQKEEPDLYKRSIKGGYWVFALRFLTQGMGLVKSIIVVNCLMLENLGLIAIAIMLMEILNTFSESGVNAALVQKKKDITDYLNTAWVISIIRGIVLFVILYFTAPLFASFKVSEENIPLAINIMRVMGLCLLIQGFRNIGVIYFQKNMEFHKTFWMGLAGTLTDIVLSITLVLIYRSAWGYVIARLVSSCVNFVLSYLLCPFRPKFHFVPEKAKELWKFGKWIFGNRILGFFISQGDDFFVWFYLGLPQLVLYRYAHRFAYLPTTDITNVISQVSYPAYSKIQTDLPRLREAYLDTLKITAFAGIPACFLVFTLGPDFIKLFLKSHMHPMILTLQIFVLKGLMGTVGANRTAIFKALRKPHTSTCLHALKLVLLFIFIFPFTNKWGINGTAMAIVLINLLINPLGFILVCRLLICPKRTMLKQLFLPLAASLIMGLFIVLIQHSILTEISYLTFFILLPIALIIYLLALWILDTFFRHGIKEMICQLTQPLFQTLTVRIALRNKNKHQEKS